jgi:hypothetical protein
MIFELKANLLSLSHVAIPVDNGAIFYREHISWHGNPDCGRNTRAWPETEAVLVNTVAAARQLRSQLA